MHKIISSKLKNVKELKIKNNKKEKVVEPMDVPASSGLL